MGIYHIKQKNLQLPTNMEENKLAFTFLQLAEETLTKAKIPLTAEEIWKKAAEYGLQEQCASSGLTPWRSISARIYVEMKKHNNSCFYIASQHPTRFALRNITMAQNSNTAPAAASKKFHERDLHPLLTAYVYSDQHFHCHTKTIYHEKSNKQRKGQNKWLHPDIVGVYFPFDDYKDATIALIDTFSECAIKLYSFEMKIKITLADLREYYFQAVSNSSWANEGYLAALEYEDGDDLLDEMRRLSAAFGIGFIQLNAENIEQSEILVPAAAKTTIDWAMVNRLAEDNSDFQDFINSINEDNKVKKVKSKYDETLSPTDLQAYIQKKQILQ